MVIPPKLVLFWTVTFFIINGCEMSNWVKKSLDLTEVVDKCGSTSFNGTLLNLTASERVILCFQNRLNPETVVGIEGMRKLGSRFGIRQKTSKNCQQCIDAGVCKEGVVYNELRIEKMGKKYVAILQDASSQLEYTSSIGYQLLLINGTVWFHNGMLASEEQQRHFPSEDGAFLADHLGLWMFGLELTAASQQKVELFSLAASEHNPAADLLEFMAHPFLLACAFEPGQPWEDPNAEIKQCVPRNGKKCYSAYFCYTSKDATMPVVSNWVFKECSCASKTKTGGDHRAMWHGIGVQICAQHNAHTNAIDLNAHVEFTFTKQKFSTGIVSVPLKKAFTTGIAPAIGQHAMFTLLMASPPVVKYIDDTGTLVMQYLPEEFSDDFGTVIFENGTAMFEQVAFSSGAISSSCDGTVSWRLNNERLYDLNCQRGPRNVRDSMTVEEYNERKFLVNKLKQKYHECLPQLQKKEPENFPPRLKSMSIRHYKELDVNADIDDSELLAGDVLWTPERLRRALADLDENCGIDGSNDESQQGRKKRFAIDHRWDWWQTENFPIRYTFAEEDLDWQLMIILARDVIQAETCVPFRHEPNLMFMGGHGLRFIRGTGCSAPYPSNVARLQDVSIGFRCEKRGIIVHEIFHALGLIHEQNRPDRDRFVYIDYSATYNPYQYKMDKGELFGQRYDYGSIMHYGDDDFLNKSLPQKLVTIALERPYQHTMGQRFAPSFKDIKVINYLYCNATCQGKKKICRNGGYLDPFHVDCTVCRCPMGYTGAVCRDVTKSDPVCGDVNPDILVTEAGKHFILSFTTTGIGRCYIRIRPQDMVMRFMLTVTKMSNFRCHLPYDNYLEIKYKRDKTPAGARLYCMESHPYMIEAEYFTEIMIIVNSAEVGLAVEIEYKAVATNQIFATPDLSCECTDPSNWFSHKRNPFSQLKVFLPLNWRSQCEKEEHENGKKLEWPSSVVFLWCRDYKETQIVINGKRTVYVKEEMKLVDANAKDETFKVSGKLVKAICQKHNGEPTWLVLSPRLGMMPIDDIICIKKDRGKSPEKK